MAGSAALSIDTKNGRDLGKCQNICKRLWVVVSGERKHVEGTDIIIVLAAAICVNTHGFIALADIIE